MKRWYVSSDGELLGAVYSSNPGGVPNAAALYPGAHELDVAPPSFKAYWSAEARAWQAAGVAPNEHCIFDYRLRQWVDPRTQQTQWDVVRNQRSALLAASDWTQLPDVPLAMKQAWADYRQALRDITLQPDPFNIIWPTPPS
jgi:hypothetical protein